MTPFGTHWRSTVATMVAAVALLSTTNTAAAGTRPLTVLRPGDVLQFTGRTYAQWSVAWWQRMLSIPVQHNPGIDSTGANCWRGAADDMFFLAGDFTGSSSGVTRNCTVTDDRPLLFPLTNVECSNIESAPFHGSTDEARENCADRIMDATLLNSLELTLDGVPVHDLGSYRFASPPFDFTVPLNDNVTGVNGVTHGRSASDGFWIMLAPPAEGHHVIHFESHVIYGTSINFPQNVTYDLTVG